MLSVNVSTYTGKNTTDVFRTSPPIGSPRTLLSPFPSLDQDMRRNSIASSMSSFATSISDISDHSMPATPTCVRSPFSSNFVDVALYDANNAQALQAFPMGASMKTLSSQAGLYGSQWATASTTSFTQQRQSVHHHENMMTDAKYFPVNMSDVSQADVMASTADSLWPLPLVAYHDVDQYLVEHMESVDDHSRSAENMWSIQSPSAQMPSSQTMLPADAVIEMNDMKYDSEFLSEQTNLNTLTQLSPRELSPRLKTPIKVKQELDVSEDRTRVKRSIHVSPTGSKTIKTERHQERIGRSRSNRAKMNELTRRKDGRYELKDFEQIPGTKQWRRVDGKPLEEPHYCQIVSTDTGEKCLRKFRRQEHLHRHMKTHSGDKDYFCQICRRTFNRNDNCWAHYWTHTKRPGKKEVRNNKYTLKTVLQFVSDPKHHEHLINKWRQETGRDHRPEEEEVEEIRPEKSHKALKKQTRASSKF